MIWMFAGLAAQMLAGGIQYGEDIKAQKRQNNIDKEYNKALRAASARQIAEINVQRGAARAQTAQALDAARRQGLAETSARKLQSAATDTMGASVDQNLMDVQVQLGEATGVLMQNATLQELSFDSTVQNTIDSTRNAVRELSNPLGSDWAATGAAVGQIGTSMMANKLEGKGWFGGNSTPRSTQQTGLSTKLGLG